MMGLETLRRVNAEATMKARAQRAKPLLLVSKDDVEDIFEKHRKRIPYVGGDCEKFDKKHPRLETFFVDISGFGSPSEPAMTMNHLQRKLTEMVEEHGSIYIAAEEMGEFQGHLAVWGGKDARKKG